MALAFGLLVAAAVAAAASEETYETLMKTGAAQCVDSPYYSEDSVDKISKYCLLISEEQDCLQYCIYKALGMQNKDHWDKNHTKVTLGPLLEEFYEEGAFSWDIELDIKYCIEKSMLPPEAELIPTDYCEVAEYVHFCIREHFPERKKIDCYPDD